jgi:hypothetical protein
MAPGWLPSAQDRVADARIFERPKKRIRVDERSFCRFG